LSFITAIAAALVSTNKQTINYSHKATFHTTLYTAFFAALWSAIDATDVAA
jgi:hypothetical protein